MSSDRYWRKLSSFRRNLKPWPSKWWRRGGGGEEDLACLQSRCKYTRNIRYFVHDQADRRGPLKQISRCSIRVLRPKENAKHPERERERGGMVVEEQRYLPWIGAQRRTREHLHSFAETCYSAPRVRLTLKKKDLSISRQRDKAQRYYTGNLLTFFAEHLDKFAHMEIIFNISFDYVSIESKRRQYLRRMRSRYKSGVGKRISITTRENVFQNHYFIGTPEN